MPIRSCLNIVDDDVTLEMTAEQYNGLADGTIVENRGPDADADDVGTVLIDNLSDIEDEDGEVSPIDVTNVNTTGQPVLHPRCGERARPMTRIPRHRILRSRMTTTRPSRPGPSWAGSV